MGAVDDEHLRSEGNAWGALVVAALLDVARGDQ